MEEFADVRSTVELRSRTGLERREFRYGSHTPNTIPKFTCGGSVRRSNPLKMVAAVKLRGCPRLQHGEPLTCDAGSRAHQLAAAAA